MSRALYLKYRPQNFDEVQGQDHVTSTLKNALALNRVAHAYLFTGPRGTGKTSTARILAKAVNCVSTTKEHPCNECVICRAINEERLMDLIEIDAASNTGVDDIRELRDKIDFKPSEAKYKVYIVDEVHMLSTSAFNALLKTLEEPPPHVIFVLATTEPNKIPATITSRCQRFDFRRATLQELIGQLSEIAHRENLRVEPAAIDLIARQATGSFRDGTSLLDQLMAFGSDVITLTQVQGLLGAASHETIREIVTSIVEAHAGRGIGAIGNAVDGGVDPRQLAREIVDYLRGVMLFQSSSGAALSATAETQSEMTALAETISAEQIVRAIRLFNQAAFELRGSASPTLPLEMALVESTFQPGAPLPARAVPARKVERVESMPLPPKPRAKEEPAPRATANTRTKKAERETDGATDTSNTSVEAAIDALTLPSVEQQWQTVLTRLRLVNKSIQALLLDAQPVALDGNLITIGFFYELHKTRVEADKNAKPQIEKIFSDIFKTPCRIRCVVSPKKQKMQAAKSDPLIREAMNLGGRITDVSE